MPPPPPPSASYNLKIIDSSDEEDDYVSVNDAYTYNSLPWAEAVPAQPVIDATDVRVIDEKKEESDPSDDETFSHADDVKDENDAVVGRKKKKKKKPKKKKKKSKIERALDEEAVAAPAETTAAAKQNGKKASSKSVTFGTVSVREYARILGTHTVPSDGGWPLGLGQLAAEHTQEQWLQLQKQHDEGSPSKHKHFPSHSHHNHPKGWLVSDFETRKQTELQQRYVQLIRDQRRRKFEKEWEKKNLNKFHHNYNTRKGHGKKRSDSCHGRSSSVRSSSGKLKMEMNAEEKEELERIVAQPVDLPQMEYLETRQYDYKKRVNAKTVDENMTEEEELIVNRRGRNPLFRMLHENERKKILLRDDDWFNQCHVISDAKQGQDEDTVDITDQTITQHIQHDLELTRIQRSDPTNLGCNCRKLHVFLPGASDKTHHKKKGSNRRLPERKVREELRRRGIAQDGMNREKLEQALHDAVESEPCCWGNDCPCFKSGIGCQADTCSCWHPSHERGGTAGAKKQESNSEARNVVDQDVHDIEQRCGNSHGMYVVNFSKIRRHREQFVTKNDDVAVGVQS
jgi:hypothetical protein